jgi:hypothetical protein
LPPLSGKNSGGGSPDKWPGAQNLAKPHLVLPSPAPPRLKNVEKRTRKSADTQVNMLDVGMRQAESHQRLIHGAFAIR